MRKVMYLVDKKPSSFIPDIEWIASYKEATADGHKILDMKLFPVDDLADEQREAREKYREKVWAKFHNKPRA